MTLLSSCTKLGDFGIKVARIKKCRFIRSWGKYLNAYLKANNLSEQPGSNLFDPLEDCQASLVVSRPAR
jgi:hypothetical protein